MYKNKVGNPLVANRSVCFWTELNPTMLKIFQTMYWIKSNQKMYKMKMMSQNLTEWVSDSLTNGRICYSCYSQLKTRLIIMFLVVHYDNTYDLWQYNTEDSLVKITTRIGGDLITITRSRDTYQKRFLSLDLTLHSTWGSSNIG